MNHGFLLIIELSTTMIEIFKAKIFQIQLKKIINQHLQDLTEYLNFITIMKGINNIVI